jgi:hypothetical protein
MVYLRMLSAVTQSSGNKTEGSSCGLLRGSVENNNKMWKEAAVVYLEGIWKTTTKCGMKQLRST